MLEAFFCFSSAIDGLTTAFKMPENGCREAKGHVLTQSSCISAVLFYLSE
mgnify:CR=1|jgi:hypothetical protein